MLIKPASGSCNMRCMYCFYADVAENRAQKNRGVMTVDMLEAIVRGALSEAEELCTFGFQGGEPTLAGLDFFRALIAFEREYNKKGVRVMHTIQTNGLLMDDEWAAFLAEHDFLTGLSIDGDRALHDALRTDAQGEDTHNRCVRAARLLKKHGAEFNILSVVTRRLSQNPDKAYRFYKNNGYRYIQFIPCIDGLNEVHGANNFSLDAKDYGAFLCRLFDLWYEDYKRGDYYSIRAFDNYIAMLGGQPPENCAMGGVCTAYPLIEADGSVYPCDFYGLDGYLLGNVRTHTFAEMLGGKTAATFVDASRTVHTACRGCEYLPLCRGGCRRDRENAGDGTLGLNCYCEAYKSFFGYALDRMRGIARGLFGGR